MTDVSRYLLTMADAAPRNAEPRLGAYSGAAKDVRSTSVSSFRFSRNVLTNLTPGNNIHVLPKLNELCACQLYRRAGSTRKVEGNAGFYLRCRCRQRPRRDASRSGIEDSVPQHSDGSDDPRLRLITVLRDQLRMTERYSEGVAYSVSGKGADGHDLTVRAKTPTAAINAGPRKHRLRVNGPSCVVSAIDKVQPLCHREAVPVIVDTVRLLARIRPHVRRQSRVCAINPGVDDRNNGSRATRTQLHIVEFEKIKESLLRLKGGDG